MTLAALAAYQELRSRRDDVELIQALRAAFVEPVEPYVQSATRAMLDGARDPFVAMAQLTKDREQHAFGAGFVFTHPDDAQDRYTAQVERCYYPEVLNANGTGKLIPIFCAFDANWIDAIDPDRDGFQVERPTTSAPAGRTAHSASAEQSVLPTPDRGGRIRPRADPPLGRRWGAPGRRPAAGKRYGTHRECAQRGPAITASVPGEEQHPGVASGHPTADVSLPRRAGRRPRSSRNAPGDDSRLATERWSAAAGFDGVSAEVPWEPRS